MNQIDVPTQAELRDLMGELSMAATGSGWDAQTSNAVFFLMWYGGSWGRVHADEVTDQLDRVRLLATSLQEWPVQEPAHRADGAPEEELVSTDYRGFRDARLLHVPTGRVVAVNSVTLHVQDHAQTQAGGRTHCGLDLAQASDVRPVDGPPRTARLPWCVSCALSISRDIGDALGWSLPARW